MICLSSSVAVLWLAAVACVLSHPQDPTPTISGPADSSQWRLQKRSLQRRAPPQSAIAEVYSQSEPRCIIFVEERPRTRIAIKLELEPLDRRAHRSNGFMPQLPSPSRIPQPGDVSRRTSLKSAHANAAIMLAQSLHLEDPKDAKGQLRDRTRWCLDAVGLVVGTWIREGFTESKSETQERKRAEQREHEEWVKIRKEREREAQEEAKAKSLMGRVKKFGSKMRSGEQRPGYSRLRERR